MSSKLNIKNILLDHFRTLTNAGEKEVSLRDITSFYLAPAIFSFLFWFYHRKVGIQISDRVDELIVSAFSIFAALLLNMQVLLLEFSDSQAPLDAGTSSRPREQVTRDKKRQDERKLFLAEIFANVSYAIAVAICLIAATLCGIFLNFQTTAALKALQLFLVLHFLLTLMMVLKRMHIVLKGKLDRV